MTSKNKEILEEDEQNQQQKMIRKKPPQVPSLGNKIQQALPHNQGFANNGNLLSEGVSGQSGISTIGGITGNHID